ncbi:hypothetical protein C8Q70DRAFT_199283 [Cubamyces menziesii]|nr:hypothetical protein C8Q70DRAFT_199283 [Cubamyces menziesii]
MGHSPPAEGTKLYSPGCYLDVATVAASCQRYTALSSPAGTAPLYAKRPRLVTVRHGLSALLVCPNMGVRSRCSSRISLGVGGRMVILCNAGDPDG